MRTTFRAATLLLACALSGAVAAQDEEGFHGYLRAGFGGSSTGGPQSCYSLGGNTLKYRLGNECDAYTKFGYTKQVAQADDVTFFATLWLAAYSPHSDFDGARTEINKAYVEARGLPFLNGGTAWIGKRDYLWSDIHMLDLWYVIPTYNSTGAGFDRIPAGPGKFSYAVFKDNDHNIASRTTGAVVDTSAAMRHNFVYQDLPVNPGGSLNAIATLVQAQGGPGRHGGWQMTVFHKQYGVAGGVNTAVLQYGVGPGTGVGPGADEGVALFGPSGSTMLGHDVSEMRAFDYLWIQPRPDFGMSFVVLMQRDKSNAQGSSTWASIGARPLFGLGRYVKLQFEFGTDRLTDPAGGPASRLTKFTVAPTISAGPGLWSRPELRAFVTYGKWNGAATPLVNAANGSGPVYGTRTSGLSSGIQVEAFF
ncbi:carbohydrate porin [Massilia sp. Root335]|uniref:maltoporin n=1 Tax=Massilia sp. Root335 TaxID=1736517 RepID=UPI0006F6606B|nr:carbohydrate porin [Massilia sp. Root335]KQV49589.1 porin [Massilia sp. Root335]